MNPSKLAPRLRRFLDEEFLRLPLLADQLIDATLNALKDRLPSISRQDRILGSDLLAKADAMRTALAQRFAESVRAQVEAELRDGALAAGAVRAMPASKLELVDDEDVAANIESSLVIQAIKDVAEDELRELATYVSALAGDMDMARDHNPLRAETYARALWEMAHSLPMSRGHQVRLMQYACAPLAALLQKSFAASCARLEAEGVEPAVYRTLVMAANARASRPYESWSGIGPDLRTMQSGMPAGTSRASSSHAALDQVINDADKVLRQVSPDASLTDLSVLGSTQRARIARHAEQSLDHQLIELLSRLFDAMLADPLVARDILVVLSRLQTSLLRLAMRDPTMLDDYAHPAWRFVDEVAHRASLLPAGSAVRFDFLRFAEGLIEGLAQETAPDAARYTWSIERLVAHDRHQIDKRLQRATADVLKLQDMENQLAEAGESFPTGAGPLDESQLETVPAALMGETRPPEPKLVDNSAWLKGLQIGDWLRVFLRGRWTRAQLLWRGQRSDVWMLADEDREKTYALRRGALERLHAEGLASATHKHSLIRAAALRVMESVSRELPG